MSPHGNALFEPKIPIDAQRPLMPTHNEALLEAYASCPPGARIYYTLEIWQSSFAQAARVVANVGDDLLFGIEAGAPRDGGAMPGRVAVRRTAAGTPHSCTRARSRAS
jgi:hypothetical protein